MKTVTLGRYSQYNTIIHRLDPRMKIAGLIFAMIAVFLGYCSWTLTFTMMTFDVILMFILLLVSKVRFKDLISQLSALWIMVILLIIINILIPPSNSTHIWFYMGSRPIYWEALCQSIKIIVRLMLMLSLTLVLTATTQPLELTYALEWYLTPLKVIKFPSHEIAMTISIALRFIPTLLDETERIMKAQASRGVDFEHGSLSMKFKGITSLIIPLFISAFETSEELANAMEAKGYDPRAKRTRYRVLKWKIADTVSFILLAGICAASLYVSISNNDFASRLLASFGITMW